MNQLVNTVNDLHDVFAAIDYPPFDLPQIVVVGSQSSGKSSVLEGIVGKDFLPRGQGICTRRPLILQLQNTVSSLYNETTESSADYGVFQHLDKKFYDFDEIKREIQRATESLLGKTKQIASDPIILKIYSRNVLNLTLVDLPGLTKIPVGDQPGDIEEQIRNMCLRYISNPNCIILAVSSATTDLANSDALKIAREVDPMGYRTIGVLSKIDIMDEGTHVLDILRGNVVNLRMGFVPVVSRNQRESEEGKRISLALEKEKHFFASNSLYKELAEKCGISYLSTMLNSVLVEKIRHCLPEIKSKISSMVINFEAELASIGNNCVEEEPQQQSVRLLSLISKYAQSINLTLDGKSQMHIATQELYGGARIAFIFKELFGKTMQRIDCFEGLTDSDIRHQIDNSSGMRHALFVPEEAFDTLMRRQLKRLEHPGLQCVDLVFTELLRIASTCEVPELSRFRLLKNEMIREMQMLVRQALGPAQHMIKDFIKIELAYINTSHPDFEGGNLAVTQLLEKLALNGERNNKRLLLKNKAAKEETTIKQTQDVFSRIPRPVTQQHLAPDTNLPIVPQSIRDTGIKEDPYRTDLQLRVIKRLMSSYFDIIRKKFMDQVPKTIMYFLVNNVKEHLQSHLVLQLHKSEKLEDLLKESGEVSKRRKYCEEMRELLLSAQSIVNKAEIFNMSNLCEPLMATHSKQSSSTSPIIPDLDDSSL